MEPDGIIEVCLCLIDKITIRNESCVLISIFFSFKQSNWDEIADNFDEMNLREDLLRGIYAYGFEKPSAIQQRAIIPCIKGNQI